MAYASGILKVLSSDLVDILADSRVPETVAKFLADKGITKVSAFADLADSKAEICTVLEEASTTITFPDNIAMQPVKSAWREADAKTKADMDARAKGEDPAKELPIGHDERRKMDEQVEAHHSFAWPAELLAGDILLGKLRRLNLKRSRHVPKLSEVKSILDHTELGGKILLYFEQGKTDGMPRGKIMDPEVVIQGLWSFKYKHQTLCVGYNHAAAPNFKDAELTTMLEYHEFVMSKALERRNGQQPPLAKLISSDHAMRTKWMLSISKGECATVTDAAKTHMSQSAFLFQDIHMPSNGKGSKGAGKRDRTPEKSDRPPKMARTGPAGGKKAGGKGKAEEPFKLETRNKDGVLCTWFNRGKCLKGDECTFIHACNFPGCGSKHMRVDKHPRPT